METQTFYTKEQYLLPLEVLAKILPSKQEQLNFMKEKLIWQGGQGMKGVLDQLEPLINNLGQEPILRAQTMYKYFKEQEQFKECFEPVIAMSPKNFLSCWVSLTPDLKTAITTTPEGKSIQEMYLPNTFCKIVSTIGLFGSEAMVLSPKDNIVISYEPEEWYSYTTKNWWEKFLIFLHLRKRILTLETSFKLGVKVVNPTHCIYTQIN
jgi:hypothetical protein